MGSSRLFTTRRFVGAIVLAALMGAVGLPTASAEAPYPITPYFGQMTLTDAVARIPFTVTDPNVCSVSLDTEFTLRTGVSLSGSMPSYVLTIDTRGWDNFWYVDFISGVVGFPILMIAKYCAGGEYALWSNPRPAALAYVSSAVTTKARREPLKVIVGFRVSDGEHFNDEYATRVDFVRNGRVQYSRTLTDSEAAKLASDSDTEFGEITYRIPAGMYSGRWSIDITTPFSKWSQPVTIARRPMVKPAKPTPPVSVASVTPTPEQAMSTITAITPSRDASGRGQISVSGMNTRISLALNFVGGGGLETTASGRWCTYHQALTDPLACTVTFTSASPYPYKVEVWINAMPGNLQRYESFTIPL